MLKNNLFPCALAALAMNLAASADYYVANDGSDDNDGLSAETPLLTIDKAISLAGPTTNIYVAPGAYQTTAQYGVNLTANLIGCGATRDDVIIRSSGEHRTLRTASTAFMTNLTIIGNTDWKADKGGAVEMNFRAAIRERFASEPSLRLAATDPMCIGFFVDNELQFQKWIPSVGTEVAEPYLELYFRICREELAKAAPGKLYLGSRFVGSANRSTRSGGAAHGAAAPPPHRFSRSRPSTGREPPFHGPRS